MSLGLSLSLLLCTLLLAAQAQSQHSILLRNVTLIEEGAEREEVTVNILIKDYKLDLITEDSIPIDKAEMSYDAAGGVVLGSLKLGEPATFLILRGDPRENTKYLLDTKTHATFAIREGRVIKNTFVTLFNKTIEESERVEKGWLAYAPPPLAVPMNYYDKSGWTRFESKYVSGLFTGGTMLDRQFWVAQDDTSRSQVGELKPFDGGEIRALRFGGVGTINLEKPWIWTIFVATHAFDKSYDAGVSDDFTIYDLRLDIPLWERASFSIGRQKEPISMERLMALGQGPMSERAAVSDALLPSRNVGVVMAGTLLNDRMIISRWCF